jgi:hypothetical protein
MEHLTPLIDEMRRQAREWEIAAMQWASKGYQGMAEAAVENAERCEKCALDIERRAAQ